jgi:hypothetical protein
MMANESPRGPHHRQLSAETRAQLRAAVLRRLRDPTATDVELKEALERVADEARRADMRVEELIIAFKALWDEIPELQGGGAAGDEARLRERLISMSIRAYYAR